MNKERIKNLNNNIKHAEQLVKDLKIQLETDKKELNDLENSTESLEEVFKPSGTWYFDADFDVDTAADCSEKWFENCYNKFETKEKAQHVANRINALLKLERIAEVLNDGWVPDYGKYDETYRYIMYYAYSDEIWKTWVTNSRSLNPYNIVFKTEELAEKAIKLMGKDLDYLK